MVNELSQLFEKANEYFLIYDKELLESEVSERTLCGALMLHLHEVLKDSKYNNYNVDVEYNRNKNGRLKTIIKTIEGLDSKIIKINCDLIVHSRGKNTKQDNLIAVEMKKSNRCEQEKQSDRDRLICLTKENDKNTYSDDGETLPKHVCGYILGVYYEINFSRRKILIEYYKQGNCFDKYEKDF